MRGKINGLSVTLKGELLVTLALNKAHADELLALNGDELDIEIQKHREKRSKDANALMWSVCRELGEVLKIPQEEVYRKAIKDVGEYEPLPIKNEAVETFCKNWASKGIGWFAERVGDSKIPGYTLVFAFYGSSTYDTKQMSRLLDYLVDDAKQCGITLKAGKDIEERARQLYG